LAERFLEVGLRARAQADDFGERLLNEIEADAALAGMKALRLDVTAANPFLQRYYLARGFLDCGHADIKGERLLILERPV
jgi:hypothetical protein